MRWSAIVLVWIVCGGVLTVLYAQNFVARLSELTLLLLTTVLVGGAAYVTRVLSGTPRP